MGNIQTYIIITYSGYKTIQNSIVHISTYTHGNTVLRIICKTIGVLEAVVRVRLGGPFYVGGVNFHLNTRATPLFRLRLLEDLQNMNKGGLIRTAPADLHYKDSSSRSTLQGQLQQIYTTRTAPADPHYKDSSSRSTLQG